MATYYARKTGNIDATDVWATTPSGTAGAVSFDPADVLVANSFTVTVNVTTDLGSAGEIRNDTTGGATSGGSFALSNGVTLTANVITGAATCLTMAGNASATVVGNITGGTATNAYGAVTTSTGTLTVVGAVTGGSGASAMGVYTNTANAKITITGNVTGGTGSSASGVYPNATAVVVTITGSVTASNTAVGGHNRGNCTMNITGTVSGVGNGSGVFNDSAGTITIVGTAIGASPGAGVGAVNGTNGTMSVTRAKGGSLAGSATGVSGSSTGATSVEEIEYGDLGASPTAGVIRLSDKSSNVAVMYRFGATKKTLTDPNASGLMPAASSVRFGTTYNGGNSIGTCYVPAASSVAFGVNVDNTTGTAALTPAAVWDYLTSSATTSGSMGERLKNAATVASVGQQLADALSPA